jgi:ABC-type cobalamin transport system ATPase subunit
MKTKKLSRQCRAIIMEKHHLLRAMRFMHLHTMLEKGYKLSITEQQEYAELLEEARIHFELE